MIPCFFAVKMLEYTQRRHRLAVALVSSFYTNRRKFPRLGAVYFFSSMRMSRVRNSTMISSFIGLHPLSRASVTAKRCLE